MLLISQKPEYGVKNAAHLVISSGLDVKVYPGRNSPGWRRVRSDIVGHPPFVKATIGLKLLNTTMMASLVLICGDVNPNPGPTADPCGICLKGCRKNQRAVQCDECDIWYHAKCIHMGRNEFDDVCRPSAAWSCSKCLFPLLQEMDFQDTAYISSTQDYADQSDVQSSVYLKRGMKIAHLNINRLLNKVDGVRELLIKFKLDILALSETWLTTDISDDEINIPGYLIARKDRSNSSKLRGGGVMFYVRENIHFTLRADLTPSDSEYIWIEITQPKCKPLLVASIYKPPDSSVSHLINSLNRNFNDISDRYNTVLLGDFNVDQLSRNNQNKLMLGSFAIENDLKQLIKTPTRVTQNSKTLIDLIYVSDSHRFIQSGVIFSTLSDHSLTYCVMKCGVPKQPPRKFEYRSFKSYNKESFVRDLSEVPWSIIESINDIDDAVLLWDKLFSSVVNIHAPLKFKRAKGTNNPWVSTKLIMIRRDRDYHYKKARIQNNAYHWNMYKKLRNYSNWEEKNLKSKYYCNLIEESKNDGAKMWKAIKTVLPNSKKLEISSILDNGKIVTDSTSIVKVMNNYFASIGKRISKVFKHCTPKFSEPFVFAISPGPC